MTRPTFGQPEKERHRRNTPVTPAFLRTLTTCCVCRAPLSPPRKLVCPACADDGATVAAVKLAVERALRGGDRERMLPKGERG